MIVKGLIKSINFSDNSCRVRLPVFETAASQGEVVVKAIMSIQPGLYNGYNEGDVVFVDFENNRLNQPVVVGKLYLGSAKETTAKASGSLSVSNLKVSSNATLPIDTKLVLDRTGTTVEVDNGITSYKSITDIIKALYKAESSVTKVSEDQSQVIAKIEVTYLSQPVNQEEPTAENPGWQPSTPTAQDEYAIWQKTTCYNYRGQILNNEIICLTSVSYFASYRLRCSTKVHAGHKQTEKLIIEAMVKLGIAEEILDKNAILVYKWGEDGEEDSIESRLELEATDLEEKNLIISLKHNSSVYDTETIMYSPLNSPILVLTNDSDFLSYKSNGEKQEESDYVETTAELYLNNSKITPDEVTVTGENPFTYSYKWELVGCTTPDNKTEAYEDTLTILNLDKDHTTATATCTVMYKGEPYTRQFTVAKLFQGTDGISISSQTTYYALIHDKYPIEANPIVKPEVENGLEILEVKKQVGDSLEALPRLDTATTPAEKAEAETYGKWSVTPPAYTEYTNGWKYWTTIKTAFSNGDVEFSTPIINEDLNSIYALAQGKTTNYYGSKDPKGLGHVLKEGDCWFYSPEIFEETSPQSQSQLYIGYYIQLPDNTYSLVTEDNIDYFIEEASLVPGTTIAYSRKLDEISSTLYQWVGNSVTGHWQDVGDELIAKKVTAQYINAFDITAKQITILTDPSKVESNTNSAIFKADGLSNPPTVTIGGFTVDATSIRSGDKTSLDSKADGVYICPDGISIGTGFKVTAGGLPQIDEIELTDAQKAELKGSNGRSVISTTKYYKLSASTLYDSGKPNVQEPSDSASQIRNKYWYKSPATFKSGYNYYESVRTIYKEADNTESFEWSTPVKNSMLTVQFINSLGITAEQITVPANDGSGNLFMADKNSSQIELGGWTIGKDQSEVGLSFDLSNEDSAQLKDISCSPADGNENYSCDYVIAGNLLTQTAYIDDNNSSISVILTGVIDSYLDINYIISTTKYYSYSDSWSQPSISLTNASGYYTATVSEWDDELKGYYANISVTEAGRTFYINEAEHFSYITSINFGFRDVDNYINITVTDATGDSTREIFPIKARQCCKGIDIGWVFRNKESSLDALHSTSNLLFEYGYDTANDYITSLTPANQSSWWTSTWQLPNSYIFYYMCKTGFRFRLCNTDNFNDVIMTPQSLSSDNAYYASELTMSNIKGIFDFNLTKLSCFLPGASESSY